MPATAIVRTRSLESRMPGNWHVLFGKRPTEKARVTGTSAAAYFTREGADGKGPGDRDLAGGLLHSEGKRGIARSLA